MTPNTPFDVSADLDSKGVEEAKVLFPNIGVFVAVDSTFPPNIETPGETFVGFPPKIDPDDEVPIEVRI